MKIQLQLKDRSIELTAQEARDLQSELNRLFGTAPEVTKEIHHHHHPTLPIYVERAPIWPQRWETICGGTSCGTGVRVSPPTFLAGQPICQ